MTKLERTLWPLIAALFLLLVGCGGRPDSGGGDGPPAGTGQAAAPRAGDAGSPHAAHADPSGLPAADPAAHSLYVLPSSWRDQRGEEVALADLTGEVRVVAMVYTHCTFACPRILAQMKKIEGELLESGLAGRVGFTLVSLDPARDTPERLREFAGSVRLDPDRWTLLTGSDSDVRALSVLLGVRYRATSDGGADHSNVVTVLDADGVPAHRLEGLDADTDPAVRAIRALLQ